MRNRNIIVFLFLSLISLTSQAQTVSPYIIVDQFGYLPDARKIAVLRDPQVGYDANESFTPGATYSVVRKFGNQVVLTGTPILWKNGMTDPSSGDRVWWFDFSSVTEAGSYYILDATNNLMSFEFDISPDVYNVVLKQAVRAFYYQRAGKEKTAQFAGVGWADGASHIGPLQDNHCRVYNAPDEASTEVDVSGGWYDAGDYNKYTNWTANYITDFMRAYTEAPSAWGDNYNLPESGNGVPDLLDEAKWGMDHLLRLQRPDGSVLSIVGLDHNSPPSAATGPSLYGTPNTSCTLNASAAFAAGAKVYESIGMNDYAQTLAQAAIAAWDWAEDHPNVIFYNNDWNSGTAGLGAGQQETDDYGRLTAKIEAAIFLFELTDENEYRDFVDDHYDEVNLIQWNFAFPFQSTNQEMLLHYASLPNATVDVADQINEVYRNAMNSGSENFPAFTSDQDPYRAHLKDYTWGSNGIKAAQGLMFINMNTYHLDNAQEAAEQYVHYIHGVNPFNLVYLSNMYSFGGDHGVNEFYHSWFGDGSPKWDRVGVSAYGPPPGFVTGGPNPGYDWDGCCPDNCGSSQNNAVCQSESIDPPKGQPAQKSYKDFNTSWPLNSWSVTENSNGYQINYIRLLSHFVQANVDCSGAQNGMAFIDSCGQCAGGNTGITPILDATACAAMTGVQGHIVDHFRIFPNPSDGRVYMDTDDEVEYTYEVYTAQGKRICAGVDTRDANFSLTAQPSGLYFVLVRKDGEVSVNKVVKK